MHVQAISSLRYRDCTRHKVFSLGQFGTAPLFRLDASMVECRQASLVRGRVLTIITQRFGCFTTIISVKRAHGTAAELVALPENTQTPHMAP